MLKVIALLGNKGSGKDTAAAIIQKLAAPQGWIVRNLKFVSRIKHITADLAGVSTEDIEDPDIKAATRAFMQQFGELAKKHFGAAIWTKHITAALEILEQSDQQNLVVISDMRFAAEVEAITGDFQIYHIMRSNAQDDPSIPSERCGEVAAEYFIPSLYNYGTLEDLTNNLANILRKQEILPSLPETAEELVSLNDPETL